MEALAVWMQMIERALAANPHLETWPGHFRHRIPELESVRRFWPEKTPVTALEIGCGNGLAAIYFSKLAGRIVASDLASVDHQAHSIGLEQARALVHVMNAGNVDVLGCSAERIPQPDGSFDLAYGIYCLEHIPDRMQALRELRRVLAPGGEILLTVPGTAWALLSPFGFYASLTSRVLNRLRRKFFPEAPASPKPGSPPTATEPKVKDLGSFRKHYPNFPFPEPHGAHATWSAELAYYRAKKWRALLEAAGFHDVRVEPISFVPPPLMSWLPAGLVGAIERFAFAHPFLHPLAQFYCLRGKKLS